MSTTSRNYRGTGSASEIARARAVRVRQDGMLQRLVATDSLPAAAVARLTLGLVMLPHASQKLFGWFGGAGLQGTYEFFTRGPLGLPGIVAATAIAFEILGSILLIMGALTRLGALMIGTVMVGAIVAAHYANGFFMNWTGKQGGEGFEYHLLAIGLALVTMMLGGGSASVDRSLTRKPADLPVVREPMTIS